MNYLALALFSMVGYGLYSVLLKVALKNLSVGVALIAVGVFFALTGAVWVLSNGAAIEGQLLWGWPIMVLVLASIIGTLSIVSFYSALAKGPASVVVPIFAMNLTVASALGIFVLDELANAPRLLGIVMAEGVSLTRHMGSAILQP